MRFRKVRMPFVDTPEKAHIAVGKINEAFHNEGVPPIVFTTLVNQEANKALRRAKAMILDMFQTFIEPLEKELGLKSTHAIGRFHQNADTEPTRTGSRRSTSRWRMMMASHTRTWKKPM